MITVHVTTVDRFHVSRRYKTLAGAQRFAQHWVGETPEIGSHYAICGDGVAKVVSNISLHKLFPKAA
jgi:hypothetical protein